MLRDEWGACMSDSSSTSEGSAYSADEWRKWVAGIIAVILVIAYIYLVVEGWRSAGDAAEEWARKVFLLGGMESLAFGAAGWLFGKEVSRKTVEALEDKAEEAGAAAEKERGNVTSLSKDLDAARSEATALAAALKVTMPDGRRGAMTIMGEADHEPPAGVTDLLNRADRVLKLYGQPGD